MSLLLSYRLNLNTKETIGSNPFNTVENYESLLVQAENNTIETGHIYKFSYMLGANATRTIVLADLGIKFLKLVCIESNNIIRYTHNSKVSEGSIIFLDNKLPETLPTVVSEHSIVITNISSEIANLTLVVVGTV